MLQKTDLLTSKTQFLWQSQCEFQCHQIRFNNIILSLMKNPNLGSAGRRISSTGHRGKLYLTLRFSRDHMLTSFQQQVKVDQGYARLAFLILTPIQVSWTLRPFTLKAYADLTGRSSLLW